MATTKYRGAKGIKGRIVGVIKKGKTKATTMYAFMPNKKYRHKGEKLPVHRLGKNIHS